MNKIEKQDNLDNNNILEEVLKNTTPEGLTNFSRKQLLDLLQSILTEIMKKEQQNYLLDNDNDKANGSYDRYLNTTLGKLFLQVPRVRTGNFRPSLLPPKYQRYDDSFKDLLFSLLINGDSKREIILKLKLMGISFSEKAYDEIFNFIKSQFIEFRNSELQSEYLFVYIDAYHCMVKDRDNRVKKSVVYTVIGIDKNANKSVLGFYSFFGSENKSTWMEVFQDLINRGLKKVLLFISDDFNGISDAIKVFFPYSDIQKCIVHLDRNLYRNMKREDAKFVSKKLKEIKYSVDTFQKGIDIFENDIIKRFHKHYPSFTQYLDNKKQEFLAFLKYPETIRKHIYSTNPVESVHSSFEKMRIKKSGFFQSKDILDVALFIVTDKLQLSWNKPMPLVKNKLYELNQIFNITFSGV